MSAQLMTSTPDLSKQKLIDYAFTQITPAPQSFADVGAVWGVDAAYTFYILDNYKTNNSNIVDHAITPEVVERANLYPKLRLHCGAMGDKKIVDDIGDVDAVLLFDVLLHQVDPDWDAILDLYAPKCKHMLIFNPQYNVGNKTIRLLDLGLAEYFDVIPHEAEEVNYRELLAEPDAIHPTLGSPWRDVHHLWQWGIIDLDLIRKMSSLGFSLVYSIDDGSFGECKRFQRRGFVFSKLEQRTTD